MIPFDGWRAVGRAMRYARQQGLARTTYYDNDTRAIEEMTWRLPDGRTVEVYRTRTRWSLDVKREPVPGRPAIVAGLIDIEDAVTVLRVLAALDLIPAELAQIHDERDERCTWCHRFGHAADQHPLPKGHPQYDAFHDASDDELMQIVIDALGPGVASNTEPKEAS